MKPPSQPTLSPKQIEHIREIEQRLVELDRMLSRLEAEQRDAANGRGTKANLTWMKSAKLPRHSER